MKNVGLISALIYTGASVILVAAFLLATLPSDYTATDRVGGAVWVFILSMIILMPTTIPRVKKKMAQVHHDD
jgi:hypothetical protein